MVQTCLSAVPTWPAEVIKRLGKGKGVDEMKTWFHAVSAQVSALTDVSPGEDSWFAGTEGLLW